MVLQDGLSQSEGERRLSVGSSLISGWIQAAKKDGPEAFRGRGNVTIHAAELRKLQQENKDLKDEVTFIKKVHFTLHWRKSFALLTWPCGDGSCAYSIN